MINLQWFFIRLTPNPAVRVGGVCNDFILLKGDVCAEIGQLFKCAPLFQAFIILGLYLQHMESLTEITGCQAISARTSPFT